MAVRTDGETVIPHQPKFTNYLDSN